MIVDDSNVMCLRRLPTKNDPPLVVDPNAVVPTQFAAENFQSIPRRRSQVLKVFSGVQNIEHLKCR